MPYITQNRRNHIDFSITTLANTITKIDPGELNYTITRLCQACSGNGRYADYNRIVGVLECVKQEFYRRAVAPYENEKAEVNGDVY